MHLVSIQFHTPANCGLTLPLARLREPWPPCRHDGTLPSNVSDPVLPPEWRAGQSHAPADSPVAICLAGLATARPVIEVVLQSRDFNRPFEIRALDGSGGGNILGIVQPAAIEFTNGATLSVEMYLAETRFTEVAVHDDIWLWQWRHPGQPWEDLARTRHRVCVTLAPPTSPWGIGSGQQLPWIDVMQVAAAWAAGAQSIDDASSRVTRSVFALGLPAGTHPQFTYLSSSFTDDDNFDCACFLAALNGCDSLPTVVECYDTASIVSTFANVLGAQLMQAAIVGSFATRPICPIGQTEFVHMPFTGGHEVAWSGPASADGLVWDACLLICRGSEPDYRPHAGRNATGLAFGAYNDQKYFWRLVAPDDAGSGIVPCPRAANRTLADLPHLCQESSRLSESRPSWFFWNLRTVPFLPPSWFPKRNTPILLQAALYAVDSMWFDSAIKVQAKTQSCRSASRAMGLLTCRLHSIPRPMTPVPFGDAGFSNLNRTEIIFARGNLFVDIRIAGPLECRLDGAARCLDLSLTDRSLTLPAHTSPAFAPVDISSFLDTGPQDNFWYRIFSAEGEVRVENGKPVYLGDHAGPQNVIVFKHQDNSQLDASTHTIDVR